MSLDAARQRRATARLLAAYLLIAATALAFPHRTAAWPILLLAHIGGAALLIWPGPVAHLLPERVSEVIADWFPLLLIPALYTELAVLNLSIWDGTYFDAVIQRWEAVLFGGQPSHELALRYPILWLSELLHASYLSYYLIIYLPPLILYLRNRRSDHRAAVFCVMVAFVVHYVFFIFFPVQGPRYLFAAPSGEVATGSVYALTHRVLEAGSSRGAAFPSSHVGVAVAQTLTAFRFLPRLAPLLALLTTGLALGAIYGGFHYATDAVVGALLGAGAWFAAPRIRRALGSQAQ
ncbi:MAG TPA: phosphatase PAP2 family protein [Longimicrobiales bacterium]|nr:phosphatase PAP2 family protein [Longimicrobiales bacterium]